MEGARHTETSAKEENELFYKQKELYFNNLIVLGFNVEYMGEKYKIDFHKNMFDTPNKSATEIIFYFLFYKLNENECKEKFKYCYPVRDAKDDQEFRKVTCNWLDTISAENRQFRFPSNIPSLLLRRAGKKFCMLLFVFSHYVLWERMKYECVDEILLGLPLSDDKLGSHLIEEYVKICRTQNNQLIQDICDIEEDLFSKYALWIKESRSLSEQYSAYSKMLAKKNADLNKLFSDLQLPRVSPQVILNCGEGSEEWTKFFHSQHKSLQEITKEWEEIDTLLSKDPALWEVYESIWSESTKYSLNFEDINANLSVNSKVFVAKHSKDPKIDLNNVIQVCKKTLDYMNSAFEQKGIPNLADFNINEENAEMRFSAMQEKRDGLFSKISKLKESLQGNHLCHFQEEQFSVQLLEPSPNPRKQYCELHELSSGSLYPGSPKLDIKTIMSDVSQSIQNESITSSFDQVLKNRSNIERISLDTTRKQLQFTQFMDQRDEKSFKTEGELKDKTETFLDFSYKESDINQDQSVATPVNQKKKRRSGKFSAADCFKLDLLNSPLTPSDLTMPNLINIPDLSPSPSSLHDFQSKKSSKS